MPISEAGSRIVHDSLKACGIRLLAALPETWLVRLLELAEADPDLTLVQPAREEEGVGICAGAHLAGRRSALVIQNHGLLASVNGIVSCAQLYRIPLLMLVSYRGAFGERDPWQTEGGRVTEPVLDALRVPYEKVERPEEAGPRIQQAQALGLAANRPTAVLLCRDLLWEDA
ncbi:MAG: thiamine pyrophosphate-binding protein [Gemmatimonadota bacterium]